MTSDRFSRRVCAWCNERVADGDGIQDYTEPEHPKLYHDTSCWASVIEFNDAAERGKKQTGKQD